MPQLPSGRKVGIDTTRLEEMTEQNAQTVQRYPIHRVKTVTDLYPFIDLILFRAAPPLARPHAYLEGSRHLEELEDLEPYRSGFTLAMLDAATQGWSMEDCQALADFLQEDRIQTHLQGVLERVLDSQRRKPPAHLPPGLFGHLTGDEL
ncbi:MAG: hypothetical protein H6974_11430 [Gammaproteobacteria bacterium]|nr:hypothetical protein [Gammaproteobacteria bacterium]